MMIKYRVICKKKTYFIIWNKYLNMYYNLESKIFNKIK